MNTQCIKLLDDLSNEESAPVILNLIRIIKNKYNAENTNFKYFIDALLIKETGSDDKKIQNETESETKVQQTEDLFEDYRLKNISFSNLRNFYLSENGIRFGLDFTQDEDFPISLFLVGGNGTGKSSIFKAIEFSYTGMSSYTLGMGFDVSRSKHYMTYGFNRIKDKGEISPDIYINTVNKGEQKIGLDDSNLFSSPAPFCSEDYIEQIKKEPNLYKYVLQQLGLDELWNLVSFLKNGIKDMQEVRDTGMATFKYTLLPEDYDDIIKVFINNDYEKVEKDEWNFQNEAYIKLNSLPEKTVLFVNDWNILRNFSEPNNLGINSLILKIGDFSDQKRNRIKILSIKYKICNECVLRMKDPDVKMYKDKLTVIKDLFDLQRNANPNNQKFYSKQFDDLSNEEQTSLISNISGLISMIDDVLYKKVEQITTNQTTETSDVNSLVLKTLSMFSSESELFSFELKKDDSPDQSHSLEVKIKVVDKGFETTPQEYFNSFRFSLYAISLKITLSFHMMNNLGRIVPIVIDDVFNAGDFDNGIKLELFVNSIYMAYREIVKAKEPLQLILLTHDEMIMASFRNGAKMNDSINKYKYKNTVNYPANLFQCGRLFPCYLSNKLEQKEENNFTNLYHYCPKKFFHRVS